MKTLINLTTDPCDLDRFASREELLALLEEDGIELSCYGEDTRGIVPPECVKGLHMNCLPFWLDFWRGDRAACLKELGDDQTIRSVFGGETPDALLRRYHKDLLNARRYGAEYVVFHVCDGSIEETFTGRSRHSDAEVIDAAADLLNELFSGTEEGPWLLLENLWYAGHRFIEPEMTARLLDRIRYRKTGLMLDTGHLLHTRLDLSSQEEGVRYVHEMLDRHGALAGRIRGVHLNQSLTGERIAQMQAYPPVLPAGYRERTELLFYYVFSIDLHRPFTCEGVPELIERIGPEYLTFELISGSLEEHRSLLKEQRAVFCNKPYLFTH